MEAAWQRAQPSRGENTLPAVGRNIKGTKKRESEEKTGATGYDCTRAFRYKLAVDSPYPLCVVIAFNISACASLKGED